MASKQRWAIAFLIAVGVWNFVGAGVFGFLINTPIVSYFEIGTGLTANHGHAAMFGVFGMLGLAGLYHRREWIRIVGDSVFLLFGALPVALAAVRSYARRTRPVGAP
jgi:nitric oxide reductase large subunit